MSADMTINEAFYNAYYEDKWEQLSFDIAVFRKLIHRTPWWAVNKRRKLQRVLDDLIALQCRTSDTLEGAK